MKVAIAQLNPVVGDIEGNFDKLTKVIKNYVASDTDLVIFPELFLTGYPPKDLLEKDWIIQKTLRYLDKIKEISKSHPGTGIILGTPTCSNSTVGNKLYNSAVLIYRGEEFFKHNKTLLPTYDVFDERRYFKEAEKIEPVLFKGVKLGINICEDMWNDHQLWTDNKYQVDPIEELAAKGAELFINISASPYYLDKEKLRSKITKNHVKKHGRKFIFVNQVGGNDELIFDGRSFIENLAGESILLPAFIDSLVELEINLEEDEVKIISDNHAKTDHVISNKNDVCEKQVKNLYNALLLGLKDYMEKCGFNKALIALSGGIDSAVTCVLAQRALGSQNVMAVTMPGPYSSKGSVEDSKKLGDNLDIDMRVIDINKIYKSFNDSLEPFFKETKENVAEENIQARIRGNLIMALSNKFGHLVLSTGNKSELAVGYCTLYGDMSGGLGVLSDVPKTMVYQLANYINKDKEIIPQNIIDKAPSAELKPDQKDEDSLPPYELLDDILYYYISLQSSPSEIARQLNIDLTLVNNIIKMVDKNEYKRQQAPPGLKITSKAFGSGRRMPIAAK